MLTDPTHYPLTRPGDVTVLQQRNEIVANGPPQRVLEIQNAWIVMIHHHQIARVIVPMHKHRGLRERLRDEEFKRGGNHLLLRARQLESEMPPDKPLRHQPELTRERLAVIRTKLCRGLASADLDVG